MTMTRNAQIDGTKAGEDGKSAAAPKKDRQFVTALARGLAVLRCFSTDQRELGSSAIARMTNLPQPTVWRLCKTLMDEGYLLPAVGGEKFQLSPAVLSLGYSALATIPITEIAKPTMTAIADRFKAGCSMGVYDGSGMLLVQRSQSPNATVVLNLHVGSRLPLAGSLIGMAYICAIRDDERDELLEKIRTSDEQNWPTFKMRIEDALREFREYGYIVDLGGLHSRISTAATAFRSSDGQVYSITCGTPTEALDIDTMRNELGPALSQLANSLSFGNVR